MNAILRFLCVIAAHYGIYEGHYELRRRIVRFVARWTKTPEGNSIPDELWPAWGHGTVTKCPGCDVDFVLENDRDSNRCYRCATDHRYPDCWNSIENGGMVIYPKDQQNRPVIWDDDLDAEPVDPEKLELAYDRMKEKFHIETVEFDNGNTFTVMRPKEKT